MILIGHSKTSYQNLGQKTEILAPMLGNQSSPKSHSNSYRGKSCDDFSLTPFNSSLFA